MATGRHTADAQDVGPHLGTTGTTSRMPKVLIAVASAVVVVGLLATGLLMFGAAISQQRTTIDRLEPGHQVTYRVTRNGSWQIEFDAPAGRLVADVRGHDGLDPMAGLIDVSNGRQIAFNDDRGDAGVRAFGGHHLDALIDIELPPGRYRLVIEGWNGQAGNGHVRFAVVGSRHVDGSAPGPRR